ncbi:MAG: hypothetical protein M1274_05500 [Actinobacteria bacterium]|nr:hypothetical protein [Actinomycetota bacterium]
MHRRSLIIIAIVAVLVVAGAAVGIVEARAQGEPALAAITPAQLIANVAEHANDVSSISGEVSWKNDILGLSMLSFGGRVPGDLSSLLMNGSGRLWAQAGKVRFEIQGGMGDTTITGDSSRIWVYSSSKNTATEYALPAKQSGTSDVTQTTAPTETAGTSVANLAATIDMYIQKLAPAATVTVGEPVRMAGRSCYMLSLVPKAPNTLLGSVEVAIDSQTFVPLHIDLFARGASDPVLKAGFDNVSYATISDDIFVFSPPQNANIEHKTLTLPQLGSHNSSDGTSPNGAESGTGKDTAELPALTVAEAAAKADFTPLTAQTADPNLAFAGANVIPAQQVDLEALLGTLPAPQSLTVPSGPITVGPTIIQRYGQGFGTIVLVQAKIPTELRDQLEQLLGSVPLLSRTTAGTVTIYQLGSALGSVALWNDEGFLFMAAGAVSQTDLGGFIASVR